MHGHRLTTRARPHAVTPLAPGARVSRAPPCARHAGEEAIFLCAVAQELACRECLLTGHAAPADCVTVEEAGRQARALGAIRPAPLTLADALPPPSS